MSRAGVILAGGTSPAGRATAQTLSAAGYRPVVLDDPQADSPDSLSDGAFPFQVVDPLDPRSVSAALDSAIASIGDICALVFCRTDHDAIGARLHQQLDAAEVRRTINSKVVGVFNLIRLVAAYMSQLDPDDDGQRGVIITNGYKHLQDPPAGVAAYVSAMGCIQGMTLAIARDLAGNGIRICSIDTDTDATVPEDFASMAQHIIENHMLNGTGITLATAGQIK